MGIDIVCGKALVEADIDAVVGQGPGGAREIDSRSGTKRFYQGRWHYFCSLRCRLLFTATPDEYIAKSSRSPR